jgi:hypothetical protein
MPEWAELRGGTERVFVPGRIRVGVDFGEDVSYDD